ncbi:hypothetical protein NQZ68_018197 [Dissostichus eleginoides]|nr:hypothetical protein NQZ68_018197 [Dissostichus eleginoides]
MYLLCITSTCNKAGQTRVNTPFFGCKTRLKQFEHGATRGELHAPRFKVRSVGLWNLLPHLPHPPGPDPPFSSNHPCSGMSHPCNYYSDVVKAKEVEGGGRKGDSAVIQFTILAGAFFSLCGHGGDRRSQQALRTLAGRSPTQKPHGQKERS